MPLAGTPLCIYPNCGALAYERHHIVYSSDDVRGDHWGAHYYCHKSTKGNKTETHAAEIVPLCRKHHQMITDYNERMWRVNRYKPLSCSQRRKYWKLFLDGMSPPGVEIEGFAQADY